MSPLLNELPHLAGTWGTAEDIEQVVASFDTELSFAASILEQLPTGIVVQGTDGAILAFNAAATRILRLSPDQLRGRTSFDPSWRSVHEDGSPFPGDTHPAIRVLGSGRQEGDVMGVRVADEEPTWIDIKALPVRSSSGNVVGAVSFFTDITVQRNAEAKTAQTLYRFEVIASEASDVMLALDEQGLITYATPSALRILGRDPVDLIGTRVRTLFHGAEVDEVGRSVDEVLGRFGASARLTLSMQLPGGPVRWFELRLKNYLHDPDMGRVLVTMIDVDDRVTAEDELRRVNADLEHRLEELDRTHQLDRVLSAATEMLSRCVDTDEVTGVLWDCLEQAFVGHPLTLHLSSPLTDEVQAAHSTGGLHPNIRTEECWALRTRRVHLSEVGGVRCHHVVDGHRAMCIPFVVDGRVVALAEVVHDHLADDSVDELTAAATSMSVRLSTAIPLAAVADLV
ncbi:MAG: PAS domain-containing protein [Actinomycetes bacterium]